MDLDGRTAVFHWRGADVTVEAVLHKGHLTCGLNMPFGKGEDCAELEDGRSALAIHDTPQTNARPEATASAPISSVSARGNRRLPLNQAQQFRAQAKGPLADLIEKQGPW